MTNIFYTDKKGGAYTQEELFENLVVDADEKFIAYVIKHMPKKVLQQYEGMDTDDIYYELENEFLQPYFLDYIGKNYYMYAFIEGRIDLLN